jgi:1-aminocyclopropane-1-carboxylate deaminase
MTYHPIFNLPYSPLSLLNDSELERHGVSVYIKRDDLIHPSVQGNKWRKLKYNLLKIKELNNPKLLTFGGAFSNHIYATAAAGKLLGIETIGVIRGERTKPLSQSLAFAEQCGMKLHFVSRSDFRNKEILAQKMGDHYNEVYVLPEGGTNELALRGCSEIIEEINQQLPKLPDFITVACGTGGTIAGIIKGADKNQKVIGLSVLKGSFIINDVTKLLSLHHNPYNPSLKSDEYSQNLDKTSPISDSFAWEINTDYHFGGYAKWTPELISFINRFRKLHNIALDPVYTGKMFFGLFDLVKKGYFPKGSTIVAVHTGGLQGIEGFNALKLKNSPIKIDVD